MVQAAWNGARDQFAIGLYGLLPILGIHRQLRVRFPDGHTKVCSPSIRTHYFSRAWKKGHLGLLVQGSDPCPFSSTSGPTGSSFAKGRNRSRISTTPADTPHCWHPI